MKFINKNPIPVLIVAFVLILIFIDSFPNLHIKVQHIYLTILKAGLNFIGSDIVYKVGNSELSLKLFAFVIISLVVLPFKLKQKILLAIFLPVLIVAINILRIAVFFNDTRVNGVFFMQNSFIIFHLLIAAILFVIWSYGLKNEKRLVISTIKENLNVSTKFGLGYLFVFSFLVLYISRFILQFVPTLTNTVYTFLVDLILNLSKYLLHLYNYPAQIIDNKIFDSHTEIIMRFPCIGINLLMVFIVFIFVGQGNKKQKLYYSSFGFLILILVNAIRVAILYAFLYDGIPSVNKIDWHDLFNLMVYLSIFLLWMKWITIQNKIRDRSIKTINHKN